MAHSLWQRSSTLADLDQFGFIANSFVAALALSQRGLSAEANYVMNSVFALGRQGFLPHFIQNAMLRIAGLRNPAVSGQDGPSLGEQAMKDVADIGPLPGTGRGVYELVSKRYTDPAMFDEKALDLIERTINRGYITEAVYSSLFLRNASQREPSFEGQMAVEGKRCHRPRPPSL